MLKKMNQGDEVKMPERRDFLLKAFKGLGVTAAGGLAWGGFIEESKSAPLILRPPGGLPEKEFLASCLKCGICVEACPYDALILAAPGGQQTCRNTILHSKN